MDRVSPKNAYIEQLATALAEGLFLVNAKGETLCLLQAVSDPHPGNSGSPSKARPTISILPAVDKVGAFAGGPARTDRPIDRVDDLDELTERERHVLGLVCQGQDDQAMSRTLGLSTNTVRNHIAALYRKIGVNRRAAAIIWAQERGISCHDALTPRARKARRKPVNDVPPARH